MCINLEHHPNLNFLMCRKFGTPYYPKLPVLICEGCVKPVAASRITLFGMTYSERLVQFCRVPEPDRILCLLQKRYWFA